MTLTGRMLTCALSVVAGIAIGHARQATPLADLLTSYDEWVHGRRADSPIQSIDLDAMRLELVRVAPTYLVPLVGRVVGMKGTCPALTFTLAGAAVRTSAATRYDKGGCAVIGNRLLVQVIRQIDPLRPAERIAIEAVDDGPLVTVDGVDVAAHARDVLKGGLAFAPEWRALPMPPVESHRRLLAALALELAAAGSSKQAAAAARLVEWACPYVRSHVPASDFDRAWHLAALAVLEGGMNPSALGAHLDHAAVAWPGEPRLVLAQAIVDEQMTATAEALDARTTGADAALMGLARPRSDAERTRAAERALKAFTDAAKDTSLHEEATLRAGHVLLGLGRYEDALRAWPDAGSTASSPPPDPALGYLARLFRGLAFDGLGRAADARASYLDALGVSPGAHSATMRLAALEFRAHRGDEADRLLQALLHDDDPRRDPWWSYYAADWRFWFARIAPVRAALR